MLEPYSLPDNLHGCLQSGVAASPPPATSGNRKKKRKGGAEATGMDSSGGAGISNGGSAGGTGVAGRLTESPSLAALGANLVAIVGWEALAGATTDVLLQNEHLSSGQHEYLLSSCSDASVRAQQDNVIEVR